MLFLNCRYARVFPHSQLLLCFIIQEFGNKRDLTSAIRAFEVLKQQSGGINMFACRSIIDICGHCGDFLRSRIILEVSMIIDKRKNEITQQELVLSCDHML